MISRLGELTALPAYRHISSYATLAMLSLINRSNACKCRTYPRRGSMWDSPNMALSKNLRISSLILARANTTLALQ